MLFRSSLRLARELGMRLPAVDQIFCLAGTAAAAGDVARGARLAGAAERHRSPSEHDADEAARYQAVVESIKAASDLDIWQRASAEGRRMSLDEAAEYALS